MERFLPYWMHDLSQIGALMILPAFGQRTVGWPGGGEIPREEVAVSTAWEVWWHILAKCLTLASCWTLWNVHVRQFPTLNFLIICVYPLSEVVVEPFNKHWPPLAMQHLHFFQTFPLFVFLICFDFRIFENVMFRCFRPCIWTVQVFSVLALQHLICVGLFVSFVWFQCFRLVNLCSKVSTFRSFGFFDCPCFSCVSLGIELWQMFSFSKRWVGDVFELFTLSWLFVIISCVHVYLHCLVVHVFVLFVFWIFQF